ncbi:Ankyrin repeat-containing protein [Colletotrichum asianum]
MAELLGTVVGVVSLGLQVSSGIAKYLGGIKGHNDDVASATRLCQSLQSTVNQLKSMQTDIANASNGHGMAIEQAMTSANAELAILRAFIDKVRMDEGPSKSISDWIEGRTMRLTYPFRRGHLDRLESQLSQANKTLQSALQIAQIAISITNNNEIRTAEGRLLAVGTDANTKLDDIHQLSSENSKSLGLLSSNLSRMSLILDTCVPQAQRHIDVSAVQISRTESQVEEVLQALISPDPQIVLQRMLSKPGALRTICDETNTSQRSIDAPPFIHVLDCDSTTEKSYLHCECRLRRGKRQSRLGLGPALFTSQSTAEGVHSFNCPLAGAAPVQKEWSLGISTRLFRTVLTTAITISMITPFGAGGFGISPSFKIHFIHKNSPAEDVIRIIRRAAAFDTGSSSAIVQKGIETLLWIFRNGKASPSDTDHVGNSLLHFACCQTRFGGGASVLQRMKPVLKFLVATGAPRDRLSDGKELPFQNLLESSAHSSMRRPVSNRESLRLMAHNYRFLMPDDFTVASDCFTPPERANPGYLMFYGEMFKGPLDITEWYGSDLHIAIMRKDHAALDRAILEDTTCIKLSETNTFGYTAMQLLWSYNLWEAKFYKFTTMENSHCLAVPSIRADIFAPSLKVSAVQIHAVAPKQLP